MALPLYSRELYLHKFSGKPTNKRLLIWVLKVNLVVGSQHLFRAFPEVARHFLVLKFLRVNMKADSTGFKEG